VNDWIAEFVGQVVAGVVGSLGTYSLMVWERRRVRDPILRELRDHRRATEGRGDDGPGHAQGQ
jgi:hypothetical protein